MEVVWKRQTSLIQKALTASPELCPCTSKWKGLCLPHQGGRAMKAQTQMETVAVLPPVLH